MSLIKDTIFALDMGEEVDIEPLLPAVSDEPVKMKLIAYGSTPNRRVVSYSYYGIVFEKRSYFDDEAFGFDGGFKW